ncbi:MAG TPA: cadmium-translocating P-type ATPase [Clostridia bacterium]|nr:cadmium-translocating P-type ATPase [Clostridia bacterium]
MEDRIRREFVLEGLGCANCAAKMEEEIKSLKGVETASLDFINKRLIIEINDKNILNGVIQETTEIIKKIEPEVVLNEEENKTKLEIATVREKKELVKFGLGILLFLIALVANLPSSVKVVMYSVSYLLVGGEIALRALKNLARGQIFDENFLMTLATVGAFAIGEYPEGVAVMIFYQIGELFQDLAVNRSRKSITALLKIRPDYANLKLQDGEKRVAPEEVKIGDLIIVKPGERIPLDGNVVEGVSLVDTSALTGESVPRRVGVGSQVLAGFINKNGLLTVEVTKIFAESTVAKILDLVQNASGRKAQTEKFITKFARYYTPAVVFTALLITFIPTLIIPGANFSQWLYRGLLFLVISCPCALVVSIPLGFFGGIGAASKQGILIKGSNYLEALNKAEIIAFDKTGTLTEGSFKVNHLEPAEGVTKEKLLEYTALAEAYSNHPIAESIINAYGKTISKEQITDYEEISGHGVKVKAGDKEILAGNMRLMEKEKVVCTPIDAAGTVVYTAVDKNYAGHLIIADRIKKDAGKAIRAVKQLGVKKTVMLTGDNETIARSVACALGLDEVYAELLPDEKVEKLERIRSLKSSQGKLVFVGDGINDAPVLALADIGVAMGGLGSDAAIEAADIVIMTDDPFDIATALKIARRTKKIIWQNIIFSLGIKAAVLVLGAFGWATMWEAVFADVGVSVIAVLNAMRILNTPPAV